MTMDKTRRISARGRSASARKPRHQLDMRRVTKLIDRGYALEAITAVDENARVAREGRCIAGDGDHVRQLACSELLGLRLRALPRRVEDHDIESAQFLWHQRTTEQIARLGLHRL